jgi:hypothetical protein
MTQTGYPLASTLVQTPQQWSNIAQNWLGTGVIKGKLNELSVYADSTGMQCKVKTGQAYMQGHFYQSDTSEVILAIATADPTNPRIDRVVVRLDYTSDSIVLAILQGVPAASPTAPAITQNNTRWEISLAQVYVGANVTTIAAGNITDERNFVKNANAIQSAWIPLTLQNGWVADSGFSTPAYRLNELGEVELQGRIKNGTTTIGTVIATLPTGYRPSAQKSYAVVSHNGSNAILGEVDVKADGTIIFVTGGNYYLSLEDIKAFSIS